MVLPPASAVFWMASNAEKRLKVYAWQPTKKSPTRQSSGTGAATTAVAHIVTHRDTIPHHIEKSDFMVSFNQFLAGDAISSDSHASRADNAQSAWFDTEPGGKMA